MALLNVRRPRRLLEDLTGSYKETTTLPPILDTEFRLLKINSIEPQVSCVVEAFPLATAERQPLRQPKYYALSYAWGDDCQKMTILVNGQAFLVTPTLYYALRQLYSHARFRREWHWIDQICIDQRNNEEKSVQVSAMHRVYAHAEATLIWLGVAANNSDLALDGMHDIFEVMDATDKLKVGSEARVNKMREQLETGWPGVVIWLAIVRLYNRPWFVRVWVLQEVMVAQHTYALCGDRIVSGQMLCKFGSYITNYYRARLQETGIYPFAEFDGFTACHGLIAVQEYYSKHKGMDFLNMAVSTRVRQATDPRDHIYGIAAMLHWQDRTLIDIDYDMDYPGLVIRTCEAYVTKQNRTRAFLLFAEASSIHRHTGLPSWCPDFSQSYSERRVASVERFGDQRAGTYTDVDSAQWVKTSRIIKNAVSVEGYRVGFVSEVVRNKPPAGDIEANALLASIWEHECNDLKLTPGPREKYPPSTLSTEIYARTLVSGLGKSGKPVKSGLNRGATLEELRRMWQAIRTTQTMPSLSEDAYDFYTAFVAQEGRTFFCTTAGHIGSGPSRLEPGDVVCIFRGARALWVLRYDQASLTKGGALLVGEAYIDDFMDLGVTLRDHANEIGPWEKFVIV